MSAVIGTCFLLSSPRWGLNHCVTFRNVSNHMCVLWGHLLSWDSTQLAKYRGSPHNSCPQIAEIHNYLKHPLNSSKNKYTSLCINRESGNHLSLNADANIYSLPYLGQVALCLISSASQNAFSLVYSRYELWKKIVVVPRTIWNYFPQIKSLTTDLQICRACL